MRIIYKKYSYRFYRIYKIAQLAGHIIHTTATSTRVFIQRVEAARTRFARSSRMVGGFGDLPLAPSSVRKMANTRT